jgi:hypothetical protein
MKFNDCIFVARLTTSPWGGEDPVTDVVITPRAFFEENGFMYDQHMALDLPESFDELAEGMFLFDGSVEEATAILESLGVGFDQAFADFIETTHEDE